MAAATECWQRGPVAGVPPVLQPVAHMLLQVQESVHELVAGLSPAQWNARPAGVASIAFHVRHIDGVIDRTFTYARGVPLSESQFAARRDEQLPVHADDIALVLQRIDDRVQQAVAELRTSDTATLGDWRGVGAAQLPSTVIGCLVHGAEHSMRHIGQLSVTVRIVRANTSAGGVT